MCHDGLVTVAADPDQWIRLNVSAGQRASLHADVRFFDGRAETFHQEPRYRDRNRTAKPKT